MITKFIQINTSIRLLDGEYNTGAIIKFSQWNYLSMNTSPPQAAFSFDMYRSEQDYLDGANTTNFFDTLQSPYNNRLSNLVVAVDAEQIFTVPAPTIAHAAMAAALTLEGLDVEEIELIS